MIADTTYNNYKFRSKDRFFTINNVDRYLLQKITFIDKKEKVVFTNHYEIHSGLQIHLLLGNILAAIIFENQR